MRAVSRTKGGMTADATTMERFLDRLDSEHGGAVTWLLAHELSEADLAALRAALVGNS